MNKEESIEIDELDELDEDEEEEEAFSVFNYGDCSFATEIVHHNIIGMTEEFQINVINRVLEKLRVTEEELALWLHERIEKDDDETDDDETVDERFDLLSDYKYSFLEEFLGFDDYKRAFMPKGLGMFCSEYGEEAEEFLTDLGFQLYSDINYGAHGHDTTGVVYIP